MYDLIGRIFGDFTLSAPFRWADLLLVIADIALAYYLIYRGLLLIKGTQAVRTLLGLLLIVVSYFAARFFGLRTFSWVLDQFFNFFIIVFVILFQDDLRRGLSRVGINPFRGPSYMSERELTGLDEVVKATASLSTKKIGALMVLEREADIMAHIQEGTALDAAISEELLFSLFLPYSPLHDGAVVINKGRIARAGCFLPLTQSAAVDKKLGTRHRAAIGLAEETDALIIVVSETDGQISLCQEGKIRRGLDQAALFNELLSVLGAKERPNSKPKKKRRQEPS